LEKKQKTVAPYSKLSLIYDEVMAHVDYELWAKYAEKILNRHGARPQSYLDVSCGTGSFLLSLYKKGKIYFGCDYSLPMLLFAKKKSYDKAIHFFRADMSSFVVKQEMDVIFCLYDSINYLSNFGLWKKFFHSVYSALRPNGLFVFDVCTELNSVIYFDNVVDQGRGSGYSYVRESFFDRNKRVHHNKFFIDLIDEPLIYVEDHQQTIFRVSEVVALIEDSPFTLLGVYDGFSFMPGSEESLRVHFVLRKPEND